MSTSDLGKQIVSFDFRQEATSLNFNKYGTNLVKKGLYKGGKVYFSYNFGNNNPYSYTIEPFTCAFFIPEDPLSSGNTNKLLVNVSTTEPISLPSIAPSNDNTVISSYSPRLNEFLYMVIDFAWYKRINNYIDFIPVQSISSLSETQIVLCKITGQGAGNKPLITYDETTYGSYYEGFDQKYTSTTTSSTGTGGQDTASFRKLIPYSSDSYLLKLDSYSSFSSTVENYSFITFPPIDGEIELLDTSDKSQKVKIIFDTSGNLDVSYSAKMKVILGTYSSSQYLYIRMTNGRLTIQNGFSSPKSYIFKSNLFNKSRILNTSTSITS